MGVSYSSLCDWKDHRFPQILEALKKGKAPVDIEVENALLKRALGYDYEEVIMESYIDPKAEGKQPERQHIRKIKKHMPPDTTAIIYWLKNRKPQQWRDRPITDGQDTTLLVKARELLEGIESAIE